MKLSSSRFHRLLFLLLPLMLWACQPMEQPPTPPPTPPPPEHQPEKVVALFIDPVTHQFLQAEILQYVQDVQRETGCVVRVFSHSYSRAAQVREELIRLSRTDLLQGSVLIGNVPAPMIEMTNPAWAYEREYPSDVFYMDLEEDAYTDADADDKYEWESWKHREAPPKKLYWTGRIKPYNSDMGPLKAYFERNHRYRTGQLRPSPSLFVYSMSQRIGPGADRLEDYLANLRDNFTRDNHLYSPEQMSILVDATPAAFLSELAREYETVTIHCHGWNTSQMLDPNGSDPNRMITATDIGSVPPQGYFYHLISCGNGNYTQEDHIAGRYLLDGNGLECLAYTTTAFMRCFWNSHDWFPHLQRGLTHGETLIQIMSKPTVVSDTGQAHYPDWNAYTLLLGDPTLKFRGGTGTRNRDGLIKCVFFRPSLPVGTAWVPPIAWNWGPVPIR